eukprot:CAMPEP_0180191720 /NCGR_PEP_ID=MMETSP0987-20121128/1592_1 /TAXON_ID=697907 /ORGANISM="non described non described, Strain CCMP2293" /LENGTH=74 /DNA_ID=CAMNT_0022146289 /DNA_START=201 /DNA_END=421 /DNA_ORIENTATION=+
MAGVRRRNGATGGSAWAVLGLVAACWVARATPFEVCWISGAPRLHTPTTRGLDTCIRGSSLSCGRALLSARRPP